MSPDTRHQWRHQYDEDRDAYEAALVQIGDLGDSLTQQHFAKDADLNEIIRRFGVKDGAIPPAAMDPRYFGDFTDAVDFRTALDQTREAQLRFDALPADLRNRFGNNPVALWTWVTNPANNEEAIKIGLLKRDPAPAPAVPQVPNP